MAEGSIQRILKYSTLSQDLLRRSLPKMLFWTTRSPQCE